MPRRSGICPAGIPLHVVLRGHNRQVCFHDVSDRATFYMFLGRHAGEFGLSVHAWVLMSNHAHLLVTPHKHDAASFVKRLSQHYARYYSTKYKHIGKLWETHFQSCFVEPGPFFLHCQRYIELNPVVSRVVSHPDSFQWSSYGNHARGMKTKFHTPHECYLELHSDPVIRQLRYQNFVANPPPRGTADQIRDAVMSGRALGSEAFRERMLKVTGSGD